MTDFQTALTEKDLALQLGLSVATLRAWRFRKTGPRFIKFGRAVRYLRSDINAFIEQNRVETSIDNGPGTGRLS
jgi:predicted DNA-binding transcriptional regulator AlpA